MAKRKTTRRRGRPPKKTPVITPAMRDFISDQRLMGRNIREIAAGLGVDEKCVRYHLEHWIEPTWRENCRERRDQEVAKVDLLERIAWEKFQLSTRPVSKRQIKQALTEEGADPMIVERVLTLTKRVGETCWLDLVRWAIDWRAKLHGSYAAEQHEHRVADARGEFRVAGRSRAEILADLAERLGHGGGNGSGG